MNDVIESNYKQLRFQEKHRKKYRFTVFVHMYHSLAKGRVSFPVMRLPSALTLPIEFLLPAYFPSQPCPLSIELRRLAVWVN